ncbi:MAG: hypothetical protein J3K34DRAFT_56490 [Monoraphidium minutum]|nr:MAG: hypothetical protein J3K34DRAFT_56490 [Monoraphidium minutum]
MLTSGSALLQRAHTGACCRHWPAPLAARRAPASAARMRARGPVPPAAAPASQQQQQQLDGALAALAAARRAAAPDDEIAAGIAAAQALAAAAGADAVFPDLNDGSFEGLTLSGRMVKMLSGDAPITLQALSFGLYQPGDLKVRTIGGDAARVFKGRRFGRENTYVISTPIRLEEAGVEGVSHAIATYHPVEGNPRRLEVRFAALRLEPSAGAAPGDLQKWLAALAGSNPGMDPGSGALEVEIPQGAMPVGWMDYSAMTQEWQLVTGNGGSTTLLRRVAE